MTLNILLIIYAVVGILFLLHIFRDDAILTGPPVVDDFARVKASIKLIHRGLPRSLIGEFSQSISPQDITVDCSKKPIIIVNLLVSRMIQHFHLPNGSVLVNFKRNLKVAGRVEITPNQDYLIELQSHYRGNLFDIAAILAHEITHIFLHRSNLWLNAEQENEVLTDTAATYLGVGWLILDTHDIGFYSGYSDALRQSGTFKVEKTLGYLTPKEFGYVLGKRSLFFKEPADQYMTSPTAKRAFQIGFRKAQQEYRVPPLQKRGFISSLIYAGQRYLYQKFSVHLNLKMAKCSYRFEGSNNAIKVIFGCPICGQKLRLPVGRKIQARCGTCQSLLACRT